MNYLIPLSFLFLAPFNSAYAQEGCITTCETYATCTTCVGTCNTCSFTTVQDPNVTNKLITSLPIDFTYSHGDTNPGNDTCSSTDCGTKTCTGITTDENKTLPVAWKGDACTMTPGNKLPATLNCRYKDYSCETFCNRYESYSCCESYKTTCPEKKEE